MLFKIGSLVKYKTIKDPGLFRLKDNMTYLYGIILGIDSRSILHDPYYKIFWITPHKSGAIRSSIFIDSLNLKLVGEPK